jgi:hypothetical protein
MEEDGEIWTDVDVEVAARLLDLRSTRRRTEWKALLGFPL